MNRDMKFQLSGWILFIVCAVLFLISSIQSGDLLLFFGSLVFLIACIFFIIPLIKN